MCQIVFYLLGREWQTRQGKFLPPWSLHCSGDVRYELLCNKLPPNLVTSNNTNLLSPSFWGLAGVLWFRVTWLQSVSWSCCHFKAQLGEDLTILVAVYRSRFLAGSKPETSISCHMGLSLGYSQHGSLLPPEQWFQERESERGQEKARWKSQSSCNLMPLLLLISTY